MTTSPAPARSPLLDGLARVAAEHPTERKLVVAPTMGTGRELLRRLARDGRGWIGFEVTTPRPLAARLAAPLLRQMALTPLDAFAQRALLDEALDAALLAAEGPFGDLSEGVGFRDGVHGALLALRLAGVSPPAVERAELRDAAKRAFLATALRRYERLLQERGRTDTAGIFHLALRALGEDEGAGPDGPDEVVLLLPGLSTRGLAGRLLRALAARGARVLEDDAVVGLDAPAGVLWKQGAPRSGHAWLHAPDAVPPEVGRPRIELFRAASIRDELREVLRRVVERDLRWDQVEIVTPDPAAYGSALHAVAAGLGVPVTYAVGLPVERTRTGRVARTYLEWIAEGFQAAPIRRLLEAGDLRPRRGPAWIAPARLARRFRALRIGWGRRRYRTRIREALAALDRLEPGPRANPEAFERRRERERAELRALRSILFPALRATPNVPDRPTEPGEPVSPAELAAGLLAFLRRVPPEDGPDRVARERVVTVLRRVEETLRRRTHFRAAVAILGSHLGVRVPGELVGDSDDVHAAPWTSAGGCLHLSDLEHGGFAGREAVFLVGLDADRFPGSGGQDPLLLDADRRALSPELPLSTEVMRERAFRVAAMFARVRGTLTLSHCAWSASEARALPPSPLLLQALRLAGGEARATFRDLEEALGPVVSPVPYARRPPLDRDDVWMRALGDGPVLRDGLAAVRRAFPRLDRGLRATEKRRGGMPGPLHGVVRPRPDEVDPRRAGRVLSSSRLEALGACPLRYLHRTVLELRPPDDPVPDPDRWLDPLARGSLLHRVFERTLRLGRERGMAVGDAALEELALAELERAAAHLRDELPEPGEGTLRRETAALRDDVRSFVRMIRERGAPWMRLEWSFGMDGAEPLELRVGEGRLLLHGVVDRIDDAGIDGIRVIDYKTGAARGFDPAAFARGRRLQHAIYARAVEAALGAPVEAGEYHFPTLKGEHEVFVYPAETAARLEELLGHMLDGVAAGRFVPTDDPEDCRFCDYAAVCRARTTTWGVSSPLASWAKEQAAMDLTGDFAHLKKVRSFED